MAEVVSEHRFCLTSRPPAVLLETSEAGVGRLHQINSEEEEEEEEKEEEEEVVVVVVVVVVVEAKYRAMLQTRSCTERAMGLSWYMPHTLKRSGRINWLKSEKGTSSPRLRMFKR